MLNEQAAAVLEIAVEVQSLAGRSEAFDVIRFSTSRPKVALLRYPGFFADPFPALQESWLVDLEARSLTVSDFSSGANPPILHRKELLLAQGHPDRSRFECLTASLEDCGAYEHPSHLIGKRVYWAAALAALGIDIQEHKVILGSQTSVSRYSNDGGVPRHRTALVRSRLSRPMQALARCGFLESGSVILDYGCGRGDDVRALAAAGLDVSGWDPYFAPDTALAPADVVNLGFVLNVIEKLEERSTTLKSAYALARRVLAVSVMAPKSKGMEHADGVLTGRGTFQKGYSQSDLKTYIHQTLDRDPVLVGPGLAFVFRSDEEEQNFLARRQRRSTTRDDDQFISPSSSSAAGFAKAPYMLNSDVFDAFWETTLELGRLPEPDEFEQTGELFSYVGSMGKAFLALPFPGKVDLINAAAKQRSDDLLVYMALNVFGRRKSFSELPTRVRRDVKGFFGNQKAGIEAAKAALLAAGDRKCTSAATSAAASCGVGVLDPEDGDYTFHVSLLDRHPSELRIILGCCEQLEMRPLDTDLVKIHGTGDRVSYFIFEDFMQRALPTLARRIVVDLRTLRVWESVVEAKTSRRVLLGKSSFMEPHTPDHDQQKLFDDNLRKRGLLRQPGLGPDLKTIWRRLADAGLGQEVLTSTVSSRPETPSRP
jgi:DNA phosphorothioation-associated putative methyltransferase